MLKVFIVSPPPVEVIIVVMFLLIYEEKSDFSRIGEVVEATQRNERVNSKIGNIEVYFYNQNIWNYLYRGLKLTPVGFQFLQCVNLEKQVEGSVFFEINCNKLIQKDIKCGARVK